jgi:hypothetical protein
MAAVSQKIPFLVGGVSQQPDSLKLPGQVRECINYYPDPTFGLLKRPGLRFTQRLNDAPAGGSWFFINKTEEDKLLVNVDFNGTIRVWDAQSGIQQTVNTPAASATTYATHTDRRSVEVLQINDYVFFLNRNKIVSANTAVEYNEEFFGFVTLNTVGYNTTYTIKLDGTDFQFVTPGAVNGAILNGQIRNGGSSYTNGVYNGVILTGGTGGSSTLATITVAGGVVTNVQITDKGNSYKNGDILSVVADDVGGTGTGFQYRVTQVGNDNPALSSTDVVNGLAAAVNNDVTYVAIAVGNSIHIERANSADFSLSSSGGLTGAGIEGFKGAVDTAAQLPRQFVDGAVVRVRSSPDSDGDDYFVRFNTSDGSATGAGVWEEVVGPDVQKGVDPVTMPHALIREANGTYTFRALSEAAANSYSLSTSVAGIPTAVTLVSAGTTRRSIGQSFPVYGGSGLNLRLRVTSTDSDGFVTGVEISRTGRGYTAADAVESATGDSFTIDNVATQTVPGESWAQNFWQDRKVGDMTTNPNPTFVGQNITGISFFKNRLVFMSRENVVCSQAGSYFDFFASTVLTLIDSDPIDLAAGSLKPIDIKHAIPRQRSLILFSDNAQYALETTTDAFSASTAELNLAASYSQTVDVAPVDTGQSIVILDTNNRATVAWEMLVGEQVGQGFQFAEITRIIPSYIPSGVYEMKASPVSGTVVMLTKEEPNTIYLFRSYNNGNERVLASWFKWELPAPVALVDFDGDTLFCLLRGDEGVALCSTLLLTESPGGAVEFEGKFIDLRIDVFDYNPTKTYDPATNITKIFFKYGAKMPANEGVLIGTTANCTIACPGIVEYLPIDTDPLEPVGERFWVEVEGDVSTRSYALGYQYTGRVDLPAFFVRDEQRSDTLNIPTIHRISIDSFDSGPFKVEVKALGRNTFTQTLPQIFANQYLAGTLPMVRNATNVVPILAKGNQVEVSFLAPDPFPVNFTSFVWEGTYNNKGIRYLL